MDHDSSSASSIYADLIAVLIAELKSLHKRPMKLKRYLIQDFIQLLNAAAECVEEKGQCKTDAADALFDSLNQFSSRHCEDNSSDDQNSICLARACHQNVAILYNWIVNEHLTAHSSNESYVDGIVKSIRKAEYATWKYLPYTYMWMQVLHLSWFYCGAPRADCCSAGF